MLRFERGFPYLAGFALATLSLNAEAQVDPVWATAESEVVPYAASYARTEHVVLDNGSAFMVASETSREGLVTTVELGSGGGTTLGQFGHQPIGGGRLSPEAVLATRGDRVLLGMTELGNRRPLVAMVDTQGNLRWVRPRYSGQARILGNGDVVLASGNTLQRINGSSGETMWMRNLLELHPDASSVAFELPSALDMDLGIPLSLSFSISTPDGLGRYPDPLLVSLSATTGELQWSQSRAASGVRTFEACAPVPTGIDVVSAYIESLGTQTDVVVERRNRFNGTLAWTTRVPAVDHNNGRCALQIVGNLIAFSSYAEAGQSTLVGLSDDGTLRWRSTLPSSLPARLQGTNDGALLVATQQALAGGLGTVLERRRASDGVADWSVEIPARNVDLRVLGSELRLGWSVDNTVSQLHLQRRAVASGALLEAVQGLAEGQGLRAADIEFIDFDPYAAMAGLGPEQRGVRVRRRNGDNGSIIWEQTHALAETPSQVLSVKLQARASQGLTLLLTYLDNNPANTTLRQTVMALNKDNGALLWQTAFPAPDFGQREVVSGLNGEVHVRQKICLDPPNCTPPLVAIARLGAGTGQSVWSVPVGETARMQTGRGLDLLIEDAGTLSMLGGTTGNPVWTQTSPSGSSGFSVYVADNGDLLSARQAMTSGVSRAFVDRRASADGALAWSASPGNPGARVAGPLITRLPDADVLLSARMVGTEPELAGVTRPLLARVDSVSGQIEWTVSPTVQRGRWMSVRPVEGSSLSHRWARSLRYVGDPGFEVEERLALTTVALANGFVGSEHQYARSYDPPLASYALGSGALIGVTPTGHALVENLSVGTNGLAMPRLEGWAPVGSNHGDLRLRVLGEPGRITAHGASTFVEIEVENASPGAVSNVGVGFASTRDGLVAQLRQCVLSVGTGSCPIVLGSGADQVLALDSGAAMVLRYEIHDPEFRPEQPLGGEGRRGLFHIDPPYAFGDHDLGDNVAEIRVATGGMSSGFE